MRQGIKRPPAAPAQRTLHHARRGMTLIEIMIAILIIGIVASFGLPRIDFEGQKATAQARALSLTFSHAQREAVSLQIDVWVAVDTTNESVRIHEDANNDGTIQGSERVVTVPLDEGTRFGASGTVPSVGFGVAGVAFTRLQGGLPAIVFHRDGSSNETTGLFLSTTKATAKNDSLKTRAVTITQSTGRPTWWTYGNGTWVQGR
ncbi:MAG: prepilin-type N-terminal cleavage/methylation domain-containing protein [Gemmatimonadales bacterium]